MIHVNSKIIERVYIVARLIFRVYVVSFLSMFEQVHSYPYVFSLQRQWNYDFWKTFETWLAVKVFNLHLINQMVSIFVCSAISFITICVASKHLTSYSLVQRNQWHLHCKISLQLYHNRLLSQSITFIMHCLMFYAHIFICYFST